MMTKDEAVTMLLDRLGITVAAEGEARVAECRVILTDALALHAQLPTDRFEVWELVADLHGRQREGTSGTTHRDVLQERIEGPFGQVFWGAVERSSEPDDRGSAADRSRD